MNDELHLLLTLGEAKGAAGESPRAPLIITDRDPPSGDRAGDSGDSGGDALIVFEGETGWMCHDRATDEVRPLRVTNWIESRGWRMKLANLQDEVECSLVDNPTTVSPEVDVRDGVSPGADPVRQRLVLREGAQWIVGRNPAEADIVLRDARVSRRHLRLFVKGGRLWLEKLSQFRIRIDDEEMEQPVPLRHGNVVRFGESSIEYRNFLEALPETADRRREPSDPSEGSAAESESPTSARTASRVRWAEVTVTSLLFAGVLGVLVWVGAAVFELMRG